MSGGTRWVKRETGEEEREGSMRGMYGAGMDCRVVPQEVDRLYDWCVRVGGCGVKVWRRSGSCERWVECGEELFCCVV